MLYKFTSSQSFCRKTLESEILWICFKNIEKSDFKNKKWNEKQFHGNLRDTKNVGNSVGHVNNFPRRADDDEQESRGGLEVTGR